jgi:hypothetical protein
MEKLLKKFDELADKYGIDENDRKEFAEIVNNLGGEIKNEGDDFDAPDMGDKDEHEAEEDEPAFN